MIINISCHNVDLQLNLYKLRCISKHLDKKHKLTS